jgi:hypothetical protein
MSKFANIKLPENFVLDPSFEELIHTLALRYPTYTFGTKGLQPDQLQWSSYPIPRMKTKPEGTPEGTRFLHRVNVHSGSQELGSIDMECGMLEGRRVAKFLMHNWRLGEREGSRSSSLKTTKLDVALRTVKKFFVPRAMTETYDKASSELTHNFHKACGTLMRPIEQGQLSPPYVDIERYVYLSINNLDIPTGFKDSFEKTFASEKYIKAMAQYNLARDMVSMLSHPVFVYDGGYLYMASSSEESAKLGDTTEVQHLTYEELPESLKNNLAVLQLCKDNEIVRDVGYRQNADAFLVIAQ